ncbi:MAG TPA: hypothetical protein HA340_04130 [Candidatus Thalassarchaeaceae archaeon]|jgi:hypothetical protein|nr:hypothetical protein [Candidatus Thalassarchaeaceae archaeon]|tara:strand:- start:1052 stop:2848 length:1797 start_codon:yes stop_codon:yes gene_type:complete
MSVNPNNYGKMNGRTNTSIFRSSVMVMLMLVTTLMAPAISFETGNEDVNELLESLIGPIATAQAADLESDSSMNPLDHVELVTSEEVGENIRLQDGFEDNDEEEDDWCMGDYVMLNITRRLSYFAVCWGSEDNPGPVSIAALEVQYLGGVNLEDFPVEGMSVPGVPLPIATVFATSLVHMIEFEDTGVPGDEANTSGNGVFDYTRNGTGLTDFDMTSAEDVHAGVSLERDWDMSSDGIEEWSDGSSMGWNFTLLAENVEYDNSDGWWMTANNDVVELIALTFHLGVEIVPVTDEVIPWWTVTLDANPNHDENSEVLADQIPFVVEDIGEQQNLTWSGVRVGTDFKYDQTIDGWDFHDANSLLMVESVIARGSFTFGLISDFMDEVNNESAGSFDEEMAYDKEDEDGNLLSPEDNRAVNKVSGTSVTWSHDYTKVPDKYHWVDTAEVGSDSITTQTANVTFQLHESESFQESNDAVSVSLYIAIGGAIYPPADYIYHDPGYAASVSIIQLGGMLLSGEIVGLQFVVVSLLGVLGLIGITIRKRKHKRILQVVDKVQSTPPQSMPSIVQPQGVIQQEAVPSMVNLDDSHPPGGGASGLLW